VLQLVKISFPLPYLAIAGRAVKDPQGREVFPIPGFGEIVKLDDAQANTARNSLSEDPALPMVFEIEFVGGQKLLFMKATEAPLVDVHKPKSASGR